MDSVKKRYYDRFGILDIHNITREQIIELFQKMYENGEKLTSLEIKSHYVILYNKVIMFFGSWLDALKMSGLEPIEISGKSTRKWSKETLLERLQNLPITDLTPKILREKHGDVYAACVRLFGSVSKALKYMNIDCKNILIKNSWTEERVINTIKDRYNAGLPINSKFITKYSTRLIKSAVKFFGSWKNAIEKAGISYEIIKSVKGWGKIYLAKDGKIYCSQTEGLVADELFKFKENNIISNYESQILITEEKKWTCDFKIYFNNGFKLLLEVDGMGNKRLRDGPYNEKHPKIKFYIDNNLPFVIITNFKQVDKIIEKYDERYNIPIKNSIIASHINPDGDAISSCIAVYNYLIKNKVNANIILKGNIPKNLTWMLDTIEFNEEINLEKFEQIIIVDAPPTKERLGWEIPKIPLVNIDHHKYRLEEHSPKNNIYVFDTYSTAEVLFRRFGIKDDILIVGAYADTYFMKNIVEVATFIVDLEITKEKTQEYLEKINYRAEKKIWKTLRDAKVHRCKKNNFVIMETHEDNIDVIEGLLKIVMEFNETICLIYGNNQAKLRTSNKEMDVSVIAKKFNGNGHNFAACINHIDNITEFKDFIKHY